ncbi:hypothetical protein H9P43_008245 [Blastocladiella emersonii ATCC 22665]|nr:hypothetical protein H9P43_008245 [Blastocladiella emersonii ATCC 22665]
MDPPEQPAAGPPPPPSPPAKAERTKLVPVPFPLRSGKISSALVRSPSPSASTPNLPRHGHDDGSRRDPDATHSDDHGPSAAAAASAASLAAPSSYEIHPFSLRFVDPACEREYLDVVRIRALGRLYWLSFIVGLSTIVHTAAWEARVYPWSSTINVWIPTRTAAFASCLLVNQLAHRCPDWTRRHFEAVSTVWAVFWYSLILAVGDVHAAWTTPIYDDPARPLPGPDTPPVYADMVSILPVPAFAIIFFAIHVCFQGLTHMHRAAIAELILAIYGTSLLIFVPYVWYRGFWSVIGGYQLCLIASHWSSYKLEYVWRHLFAETRRDRAMVASAMLGTQFLLNKPNAAAAAATAAADPARELKTRIVAAASLPQLFTAPNLAELERAVSGGSAIAEGERENGMIHGSTFAAALSPSPLPLPLPSPQSAASSIPPASGISPTLPLLPPTPPNPSPARTMHERDVSATVSSAVASSRYASSLANLRDEKPGAAAAAAATERRPSSARRTRFVNGLRTIHSKLLADARANVEVMAATAFVHDLRYSNSSLVALSAPGTQSRAAAAIGSNEGTSAPPSPTHSIPVPVAPPVEPMAPRYRVMWWLRRAGKRRRKLPGDPKLAEILGSWRYQLWNLFPATLERRFEQIRRDPIRLEGRYNVGFLTLAAVFEIAFSYEHYIATMGRPEYLVLGVPLFWIMVVWVVVLQLLDLVPLLPQCRWSGRKLLLFNLTMYLLVILRSILGMVIEAVNGDRSLTATHMMSVIRTLLFLSVESGLTYVYFLIGSLIIIGINTALVVLVQGPANTTMSAALLRVALGQLVGALVSKGEEHFNRQFYLGINVFRTTEESVVASDVLSRQPNTVTASRLPANSASGIPLVHRGVVEHNTTMY